MITNLLTGERHIIDHLDKDPRIVWTKCNIRLTNNLTLHPEGHLKVLPDCYCQDKERTNCEVCFEGRREAKHKA